MGIAIEVSGDGTVIRFDGDLTIFEVSEYRKTILASSGLKGAVTVDLGAVEDVDSAGLQFLISLQKHLSSLDIKPVFSPIGEAVEEGLKLLNLTPCIEPVVASAS